MKKSFFYGSLFLVGISGKTEAMESFLESQEMAPIYLASKEKLFADIYFDFLSLQESYKVLLLPNIQEKFFENLSVMFDPRMGKPVHVPQKVAHGWRCLWEKLYKAAINTALCSQEKEREQMEALKSLLQIHRRKIEENFPEVASQLGEGEGCAVCREVSIKLAREVYGY